MSKSFYTHEAKLTLQTSNRKSVFDKGRSFYPEMIVADTQLDYPQTRIIIKISSPYSFLKEAKMVSVVKTPRCI